jgi:hypothetical protein
MAVLPARPFVPAGVILNIQEEGRLPLSQPCMLPTVGPPAQSKEENGTVVVQGGTAVVTTVIAPALEWMSPPCTVS